MPNIKVPANFSQKANMPSASKDEFDTAHGVGGKHLAPKKPLDYVVSFLTLTAISAALAAGGLLGLRVIDAAVIFTGIVGLQNQEGIPVIEISLVDGTNSAIANPIGEDLREQGWNIVSALSLSDIDPNLPPAASTLIFISSEDHRLAALMLQASFPGAPIQLSTQFEAPITVLIGTDYQG